eukprot:689757-Rhodomonas_salina.3
MTFFPVLSRKSDRHVTRRGKHVVGLWQHGTMGPLAVRNISCGPEAIRNIACGARAAQDSAQQVWPATD